MTRSIHGLHPPAEVPNEMLSPADIILFRNPIFIRVTIEIVYLIN